MTKAPKTVDEKIQAATMLNRLRHQCDTRCRCPVCGAPGWYLPGKGVHVCSDMACSWRDK